MKRYKQYDAIAKARERNMPASIAVSYDLKSKCTTQSR